MKKDLNEKILYISLHNFLKSRFGNRVITRKDLYCELGRHFLIPRSIRDASIKELVDMEMMKRIDKDSFQLNNLEIDFEKQQHEIFQKWNLFCCH